MDNKEFDQAMRGIAFEALSDAYEFSRDSKSLEGLMKSAELAAKMIDFTKPPNPIGMHNQT
jgi:hypothetical protein